MIITQQSTVGATGGYVSGSARDRFAANYCNICFIFIKFIILLKIKKKLGTYVLLVGIYD